jgi:hypothetical protein
MVLDLFTLAGLGTTVGATEAVHRQRLLDKEAEAEERQDEFYLDVFCDAQSRRRDEVHDAIVVLKDGKVTSTIALISNQEIMLTHIYRSVCGPKIPRPNFQPRALKVTKSLLTPSQASTYPSQPKTSRIAQYHTLPLSALSAPYLPRTATPRLLNPS